MSTLNPKLDFEVISTTNPKTLIVSDISSWGIIKDSPAIITLKLPNSTKAKVYTLEKLRNNVFTPDNLNINQTELSDGLYEITITGSPGKFSVSKCHLKTSKALMKLYNLYCEAYKEDDKDLKASLQNVKNQIFAAEACTAMGNGEKGACMLKEASDTLSTMKECECKTC